MPDPIREQILAAVKTRLASISVSTGYQTNVEEVLRVPEPASDAIGDPSVQIVDRGDVTRRHARLAYENLMDLDIFVVVKEGDSDDLSKECQKVMSDVAQAVEVDDTWGGLAVVTHIGTQASVTSEPLGMTGAARSTLRILYRVESADPTTARVI